MKIPKMNPERFGQRLKELRKEKFGSMDKFCEVFSKATDCALSKASLSRWEQGTQEPSLSYLVLLADFFCVSPDYLMGRSCDRLGIPLDTRTKAEQLQDLLDRDEFEAVRLFARLDVKGRTKALSLLYQLAGEE